MKKVESILKSTPLNFAHRGFSGKYPENTMLAFEKAYETGVDGIELDVQFTKDYELVIIHDSTVDRTTNGKGLVKELTLNEVRELNAASNSKGVFEKIPTLEEYAMWAADKKIVTNIELKTNIYEYPGIERETIALIKEYDLQGQVVLSSFNHYTIQRVKEIAPEMKCGLLTSDWLVNFGKYAMEMNVECVHPAFYTLKNKQVLQNIQEHHLEINTWTVNEEMHMKQLMEAGVTSIITNFPDKLSAVLAEQK